MVNRRKRQAIVLTSKDDGGWDINQAYEHSLKPLPLPSPHSFHSKLRACSLANPILIYRLPRTSLPVSTPNIIRHSRLTVCLPDSLGLTAAYRPLSILFWLSACE